MSVNELWNIFRVGEAVFAGNGGWMDVNARGFYPRLNILVKQTRKLNELLSWNGQLCATN